MAPGVCVRDFLSPSRRLRTFPLAARELYTHTDTAITKSEAPQPSGDLFRIPLLRHTHTHTQHTEKLFSR